jgi:hypothetical protein
MKISREIEAGDLREFPMTAERQNIGHILDIMGKLTNQPSAVMNMLKPKDVTKLASVFESFF